MIGNWRGVWSLYKFEMARFGRTAATSLMLPVVMTCLYFVVFGSAIGSRMTEIGGVPYGAFIVPGLMMLTMFTESINNASFGIYLPNGPARFTKCSPRRCPRSRWLSPMSARLRPNQC
jgi:ABC-2 type transport system permease protein